MCPPLSSSCSRAATTGTRFSSRTRAVQSDKSAARVAKDARMLRDTSAEINRRANPIPHPNVPGPLFIRLQIIQAELLFRLEIATPGAKDGRPVRTRTADLVRVKDAL